MNRAIALLGALVIAPCLLARSVEDPQAIGETLDTRLFNACNACDLAAFRNLLAVDVES
jgi:hypothetical protein